MGVSVAAEKVTTTVPIDLMLVMLEQKLTSLCAHQFVLWDSGRGRGWMVSGDTAALHLFRVHVKYLRGAQDFDFLSLNKLGDSAATASKVLQDVDNLQKIVVPGPKEGEKKPEDPDNSQAAKDQPKPKRVCDVLEGIYTVLLRIIDLTLEINDRHGVPGPLQMWFAKRWGTTVRGWDFTDLASCDTAHVYVYKMDTNPGWLRWTKDLGAPFLFVKGMGEILEPKAGSCCPYFQTLPRGMNFLASDMQVLKRLITKFGGDDEDNLPDKTVARLSLTQAWERRLPPFARPNCRGDHLNTLDPTCFPVQGFQTSSLLKNDEKNVARDIKLLKDNPKLYTKGEILAMIKNNENGVVVFGRQPGSEELKNMYRQNQQNSQAGTQHTVNAAPTAAQPSSRPSSRRTTPGPPPPAADPTPPTQSGPKSSGVRPAESSLSVKSSTPSKKTHTQLPQAGATERPSSSQSLTSHASASDVRGASNPTKAPGQPSVVSAKREPSISSIRSTTSSMHSNSRDAGPGAERPRASAPQASTSQPPTASAQRTPSVSSVRSTSLKTHPKAPTTATAAGQAQTSSPQLSANSIQKTASNASLRSSNSIPRPTAAVTDRGRPGETTTEPNAPTAARKPSNSSVRTTSSVDSKVTGGSTVQIPAAQPPIPALKKTTTDSSDRTTSSRTSRSTQSSTAGSTSANSHQRQQRLGQLGAATAVTAMTEGHHPTSSGPAPTAGGGQEG